MSIARRGCLIFFYLRSNGDQFSTKIGSCIEMVNPATISNRYQILGDLDENCEDRAHSSGLPRTK